MGNCEGEMKTLKASGSYAYTYSGQSGSDMVDECLREKLRSFIENEARSCSMDFGCITPSYVYRMLGGEFSIRDIENGLVELWQEVFNNQTH